MVMDDDASGWAAKYWQCSLINNLQSNSFRSTIALDKVAKQWPSGSTLTINHKLHIYIAKCRFWTKFSFKLDLKKFFYFNLFN